MAKIIKVIEETGEEWIKHASDTVLACRAAGHAWPKLRPGKISRHIKVTPQRTGVYQLMQICRDCGMERTLTTLPGGEIDFPAHYRYVQPDGYKAPKGSHVKPRECLAEAWRRVRETIPVNPDGD